MTAIQQKKWNSQTKTEHSLRKHPKSPLTHIGSGRNYGILYVWSPYSSLAVTAPSCPTAQLEIPVWFQSGLGAVWQHAVPANSDQFRSDCQSGRVSSLNIQPEVGVGRSFPHPDWLLCTCPTGALARLEHLPDWSTCPTGQTGAFARLPD